MRVATLAVAFVAVANVSTAPIPVSKGGFSNRLLSEVSFPIRIPYAVVGA